MILASQISSARTRNNERQLEKELARFFARLGEEVQSLLREYWNDNLMIGQVDLITKPIREAGAEYYHILQKYDKREYKLGIQEARRLVQLSNNKIAEKTIKLRLLRPHDLFATLREAEEDLLNKVFVASQYTLTRVDTSIKNIILEGYRSGEGIEKVARDLNKRFNQLETWEARRIARTEIHNSHNTAVHDSYVEMGVEYSMWLTADDDRVRGNNPKDLADHVKMHGEIVRVGEPYSNGLYYPGEPNGPIEEWINCRCVEAPYNVPYGFTAPPFSPFREKDIIQIK